MTPGITVRDRSVHESGGFFSGVPRLLKILALIAVWCWLMLFLATAVGCSADRQARVHDRVAAVSDDAADKIDAGLAALPDDPAAGPVNPDAVRPLLPAEWLPTFEALLASGSDAKDSAGEISAELRALAEANRASAAEIRTQIAAGADKWALAATQTGAAATAINPALGLAATVVGGIAGAVAAWRRGKATGAERTARIVNAGIAADSAMRNAVKSGAAGEAMKKATSTIDDRVVAKAIERTKL